MTNREIAKIAEEMGLITWRQTDRVIKGKDVYVEAGESSGTWPVSGLRAEVIKRLKEVDA
jgi:hypothetical protein